MGLPTFHPSRLQVFALVAITAALPLAAQQPVSASGTGSVTGHVTCGDTQRPARFATVTLFGVPADVSTKPKLDDSADPAALKAAMSEAMESLGKLKMSTAQTDMNGSFTATDVAPGDYYVFASSPGYVSPVNQVQAAFNDGADKKKPLPGVQILHVAAEHTVNADTTMQRGAAISGTVLWDDGSPVTGAQVKVVPLKGDPKDFPPQFAMLAVGGGSSALLGLLAVTDDLGHFRIAGLAPGDVYLQATLQTSNNMGFGSGMNLTRMMAVKPLLLYAPAAFHKADAKAITLHAGEDRRDAQITINLGGLHTVSGRVGSAEDHHGLNSATVQLTDAQDKDLVRSASVDAVGSFTVTYVPSGTYNLTVTSAADTEAVKKKDKGLFATDKTLRSYDDARQSLIVSDTDIAGLNLELAPSKNKKKDLDLKGLMTDDDDDKP